MNNSDLATQNIRPAGRGQRLITLEPHGIRPAGRGQRLISLEPHGIYILMNFCLPIHFKIVFGISNKLK